MVLFLFTGYLGGIFLEVFRVGSLFWNSGIVILPALLGYGRIQIKVMLMKTCKIAKCYICVFCLLLIFKMYLVKIDLLLTIILLSILM